MILTMISSGNSWIGKYKLLLLDSSSMVDEINGKYLFGSKYSLKPFVVFVPLFLLLLLLLWLSNDRFETFLNKKWIEPVDGILLPWSSSLLLFESFTDLCFLDTILPILFDEDGGDDDDDDDEEFVWGEVGVEFNGWGIDEVEFDNTDDEVGDNGDINDPILFKLLEVKSDDDGAEKTDVDDVCSTFDGGTPLFDSFEKNVS